MKKIIRLGLVLGALSALGMPAFAAPCLTNPADQVGNAAFSATVSTFIGLGIDPNVTCIENALWASPTGFGFGSYIRGASGQGEGINNGVLGSYGGYGGTPAQAANALDHAWVQNGAPNANPGGAVGSAPSAGLIWDLGGPANQAAVFVFVDHGPVPGEVLENTAWFSNDPNAPDSGWTQASLNHVYGYGWDADPAISDGFVAVYALPSNATFRYVSVTWGGPGAIVRDGDNEIDAVGGLSQSGHGVVPEPGSVLLLGAGLGLLGMFKRSRRS